MPPRRKNFGGTTAHAMQQGVGISFKGFVLGRKIEGYMLWMRFQSGHKLEERQIEVLSKDIQTEAKRLYGQVVSMLIAK